MTLEDFQEALAAEFYADSLDHLEYAISERIARFDAA